MMLLRSDLSRLFFATLCALPLGCACAQGVNAPADFTVHSGVVAANPPRAGFNFSPSDTGLNIPYNAWISDSGAAPADARGLFRADGGDANSFYETDQLDDKKQQHAPGTDIWDTIQTGYYDGAQALVYRLVNDQWTLLRTGSVSKFVAVSNSNSPDDHRVTFDKSGPAMQKDDVVWLTRDAILNVDVGKNISFVDMHSKLTAPQDLGDAVHPNDAGYQKMAQAWVNAILALPKGNAGASVRRGAH